MMGTGCMKLLLLLISSQVDEMVMSSRDKYDQHDFDPPNSQIPADYPVHEEGLSDVTEPIAAGSKPLETRARIEVKAD